MGVYTRTRLCTHTHRTFPPHHPNAHTHAHANTCIHVFAYTYAEVRACVCVCVYACVHVGVPRWLNAVLSERTIKCLAHGLAPCAQRCAAGERVSEAR